MGLFGRIGLGLLVATASALASPSPAGAAVPAYSSSYVGESAFTSVGPGSDGQFSAVFFNDGTNVWQAGTVGLLVCASNKTTCNVSWNPQYAKDWYSPTVYATVTTPVQPGQTGFFVYSFTVPAGTSVGTVMTFNGEVGLIANGQLMHPEGYFQVNTVPLTVQLTPSTLSVPVGGFQQFSASGVGPSTLWTVSGGCGTITTNGLFIATAMNSKQQPCSVTASSSGRTASAPITVFGNVAQMSCATASTQLIADGGSASAGTTVVSVSLLDPNGNLVSNAGAPQINVLNVTPSLATMSPLGLVTPAAGVATVTVHTTLAAGTIQLSATSTLGGCTALIPSVGAGLATKTVASFLADPIASDGISTSTLQIDVTDAKGLRATGDNLTQITALPAMSFCTVIGFTQGVGVMLNSGQGTATVVNGRVGFTLRSTNTPGQCLVTVTTNNVSIAGTTAMLTTRSTSLAAKLAIVSNDTPHPAAQFAACGLNTPTNTDASCTTIVIAVTDAVGATITGDANRSITATLDPSSCSGAGGGDAQLRQSTTTSGGTATFFFSSGGAYGGCAVTFASTGLSGLNTTLSWIAGLANHLGCVFTPSSVSAGTGAMPVGVVTVRDAIGNLVPSGTYSVLFTRTSGTSTTIVTPGQQYTTAGAAYFTVRASGPGGIDTWTPSLATAFLPGASTSCTIGVF